MLKNRLLTTTALMIVGSISLAAAQSAAISGGKLANTGVASTSFKSPPVKMAASAYVHGAGVPSRVGLAPAQGVLTTFDSPGRDRNREFLCAYGYTVYHYYSQSSETRRGWVHYAVPITGTGATVSKITVMDGPSSDSDSRRFVVGIYQSTKKGKPGKVIASGKGLASVSCSKTTVVIPKTFLTAGETYWIEERLHVPNSGAGSYYHAVKWGYSSNAKHNAYYQTYAFAMSSSSYSSLSDWLPVSGPAPFVRVK
jgi:hypothetical protein